MTEETKKELIEVHQILQTIFVRGMDAVNMGNALMKLGQVIEKAEGENNDSN